MAKNIAFVFPGQGAQYSGMGNDFYNQYEKAKQIYDYASEICNIDVKKICFDSSDSRIHETKYTQIAIFTTSLAILECVHEMGVTSTVNAGLSLGEYTALAASNVIDIKDLFLLVKKRGKYMQEAFPTGGAMAAVIGLSEREVVAICNQMNGNIYIANYNCPGQIVVTGEKAVVEASYEIFQKKGGIHMNIIHTGDWHLGKISKKGAKMVLPLNVSGPFHSPLLETAKKKLEISLKDVQINNFIIPYVSNVNAKYINYSCDIKSLLSEQIVSSVKWQQSIKEMIRQGVDLFIEVGPGSTLTNLIRKIDPGVEVLNIQAVGDMKTLLKVN